MPTNIPTLEQLEQGQAEAQARVEAARAAADRLRQQAEERREQAQREHDEALLRDWQDDHAALPGSGARRPRVAVLP